MQISKRSMRRPCPASRRQPGSHSLLVVVVAVAACVLAECAGVAADVVAVADDTQPPAQPDTAVDLAPAVENTAPVDPKAALDARCTAAARALDPAAGHSGGVAVVGKRRDEVGRTLQTLRDCAQTGHVAARLRLADVAFSGAWEQPQSLQRAFEEYSRLADEHGNPHAQFMLGFYHAVGGLVPQAPRDQAKAFVYYSFAAGADDLSANMALSYRYSAGIGVEKSCFHSVEFLRRAADIVMADYDSRLPVWPSGGVQKVRLASEEGGVYGPGASGAGAPDVDPINVAHTQEDVIQFYHFNAERGDAGAQLVLGQLYLQGSAAVPRNFERAYKYLRAAASQLPPRSPATGANAVPLGGGADADEEAAQRNQLTETASMAAALLGQMYWRGDGIQQDNATALRWFHRAAEHGSAAGLNNLGLMYQRGVVVPQNVPKAVKLFQKAADMDHADAQVNLARILLREARPDYGRVLKYLTLAAKQGHLMVQYHLGKMYETGNGLPVSCQLATMLYKTAVERSEMATATLSQAFAAHQRKDNEASLLMYLVASELGFEVAQSNAAWLLDTGRAHFGASTNSNADGSTGADATGHSSSAAMALVQWNRAANQGNVDARMKLGDYYYYGRGTDVDYASAAAYYQAAESEHSAMAMFNLGFMHENGVGLAQDFHLAKRYYDRALSTNPQASLPVTLALMSLRVKYFFHWLVHGGPFSLDSPAASGGSAAADGSGNGGGKAADSHSATSLLLDDQQLAEILRGEDVLAQQPHPPPHRNHHHNQQQQQQHLDARDDMDDEGNGYQFGGGGAADDTESMLILLLMLALGFLVWARNGVVRQQEQQQQQAQRGQINRDQINRQQQLREDPIVAPAPAVAVREVPAVADAAAADQPAAAAPEPSPTQAGSNAQAGTDTDSLRQRRAPPASNDNEDGDGEQPRQ